MKKNILLLVIVFLLTGCTFNYDTKIMLDGSVRENVNDKTYVSEMFDEDTVSVSKDILKKTTLYYLDTLNVKADDITYKDDSVTVFLTNVYDSVDSFS